ncbi:hypothetical protein ABZZ74_47920 [Streptomyces sp. NPDC006476]|uniref:hypothetical protein n=1 Tax=Streptomyces sp. NPDC006476 TaxID=3157175 RepID=UPI0033AAF749
MADSYGFSTMITVHVIDGHAGSPDTVHFFDSGETYVVNEWGDRAPCAVAVRVSWGGKTPTVKKVPVNRETRRAARKTQKKARGGRGAAARAAVICINWQRVGEEGSGALDVVEPLADGRYPIGGYEWPWCLVTWTCACDYSMGWHETECLCGLTRDGQPEPGPAAAAHKAGVELQTLAPEATRSVQEELQRPGQVASEPAQPAASKPSKALFTPPLFTSSARAVEGTRRWTTGHVSFMNVRHGQLSGGVAH